jgi:hypothetical protein
MHTDSRKEAEAFIEKVVAPRREPRGTDPKAVRARTELARKELELAKRELAEGGFDPERFDKLAAARSKERKKLAEETRRNAIKSSAAAARRLADLAPVILPAEPLETVIDQVTFIRSFAGQGVVVDSNIGPSDNWARYRLESSGDSWDGTGRLSFFTLWQNARNSTTIVTARANLVVNAHISCDADWNGVASWFGMDSEARGTVRARTTVWSMDSSVSSIVHDEVLAAASASGGFFGDESSKSIAFNELLPASGVAVLPQAYSLIEVELFTEWHAHSASVTLDAEGGSHRVDVPQIVLTEIWTPEPTPTPPISLTVSVSYATSPATVTLNWSGATASTVDIYLNGALYATRGNDGEARLTLGPGTYTFRVCNAGTAVCSTNVGVTVTQ